MPCVSAIVPNYNRAGLIGATITNLLTQTKPPDEIIVVDDGSTDGSVDVVRSFGPRIQLIQQYNQGPGTARNAGLQLATGKYIQFQDSDDLLSLNKLESQSELLERTGADIAFSPWAHVFIEHSAVHFQTCVLQQELPPDSVSLACWILRGWSTTFQSLLFRREFLSYVGCYDTDVKFGEDTEFFFRLVGKTPRVAFTGAPLTLYRVDSQNRLSHERGLPQQRRNLDWAVCLDRMRKHQSRARVPVDRITQAIFRTSIRKHLRYVKHVDASVAPYLQRLTAEAKKSPAAWLALIELWLRIVERLRLMRSGFRWLSAYRAGGADRRQLALIRELGFSVVPPHS